MIVQCPNCDSRYRVNDANVPASGGKITCPSCGDKFIVYPDAPDSHTQNSFEDKTSVAKAPALRELVNKMSPQRTEPDDLNAATEVMSSLDIPDSLTSDTQNIATDGTVEMASPDIAQLRAQDQAHQEADEYGGDFASTEILSSDALDSLGFHLPSDANDSPHFGETREHAPLRTQLESSAATGRLTLDNTPQMQSAPTRERPSLQPPQFGLDDTALFTPPAKPKPPALPPLPNPPALPKPAAATLPEPQGDSIEFFEPDPPAADPAHEGPWKLKTNFGLTYEFSDNASLKSWLSNRDDLDGYELAGDADFFPVHAWPQFQPRRPNRTVGMAAIPMRGPLDPTPAPAGPEPTHRSGPFDQVSATPHLGLNTPQFSSTGPTPSWDPPVSAQPPRQPIQPQNARAPSADSKLNLILWPIAGVLFAIGVLLAVQVLGVYDVKSALFGPAGDPPPSQAQPASQEPAPIAAPASPPGEPVDPNAVTPEVTRAVDRLLKDAEQAMANNRLQSASVKLNNAKLLDPERVSIYVLFVEVYTKMGRTEDAQAAQKTLDELRGAPTQDIDKIPGEDEDED